MARLLFVVNVDWFFLSHRLPIALAARDAGFDVHVATELTGEASAIQSHGFTLHPISINRSSVGPLSLVILLWTLWRLMRQVNPEIVHLVTIKPVLLGGLAARFVGIKRVIAAISGLGFVFTARGVRAAVRRWLVAFLYRGALARSGVFVILQNDDDQTLLQTYAGISASQVVRIRGSGVDLSDWSPHPLPVGVPIVLMASRLLVDKGVREFIDAARALRGVIEARFVLVGDVDSGNPTSVRRDYLLSYVDSGVIEWWGKRDDMQHVLAASHVVVLPSYREGLPKVLIEAAAVGRAVVTTDVPGCRDAIIDGCTGLLVAPRDAVALATAIRSLVNDPQQLHAFGVAGRELAEKAFDVRDVISTHLQLYREEILNS
jgi:glycosyltransferase involved in cell wall biosynthesis